MQCAAILSILSVGCILCMIVKEKETKGERRRMNSWCGRVGALGELSVVLF